MQHPKDSGNLSEIGTAFKTPDLLSGTFSRVLKSFNLNPINKLFSWAKVKGVAAPDIFKTLFLLPFVDVLNINALQLSGYSPSLCAKKDAFYTFLKNPWVDWRKVVLHFARQFVKITAAKSVDGDAAQSPRCFIVDDSLLEKTGTAIEFIGKVFDHCSHTYRLGMKMLTLGYWDGKSFIPVDFSVHNEPGKNKNRGLRKKDLASQFSKQREEGCAAMERVGEVSESKTDTALKMIKSAVKKGFAPQYVLADSWFINDDFIKAITQIKTKSGHGIAVMGLMKTNRKVCVDGKDTMAALLPETKRGRIRKCGKLKCAYIALQATYKGTAVKLFFVKMDGQNTWKMLVSTDTTLTFTKAMEYYQIRWAIEVFFKEAKQYLYLGKNQSVDFDAQIASASIVFINYIALSLAKRFEAYETMGQLFKTFKDIILQNNIVQRLWALIIEIYSILLAGLGIDEDLFIQRLINDNSIIQKMKDTVSFLMIFEDSNNKKAA
jgi:hypothetical protein